MKYGFLPGTGYGSRFGAWCYRHCNLVRAASIFCDAAGYSPRLIYIDVDVDVEMLCVVVVCGSCVVLVLVLVVEVTLVRGRT